jgi:hypothetical protein
VSRKANSPSAAELGGRGGADEEGVAPFVLGDEVVEVGGEAFLATVWAPLETQSFEG